MELHFRYDRTNDKYEYRINGDEEWNQYEEGDKINGLEIKLPENKPIVDREWSLEVKHVEPHSENFISDDVVKVSDSHE